jgi:DNA repair exonuclease SbcCD ATPase subunit
MDEIERLTRELDELKLIAGGRRELLEELVPIEDAYLDMIEKARERLAPSPEPLPPPAPRPPSPPTEPWRPDCLAPLRLKNREIQRLERLLAEREEEFEELRTRLEDELQQVDEEDREAKRAENELLLLEHEEEELTALREVVKAGAYRATFYELFRYDHRDIDGRPELWFYLEAELAVDCYASIPQLRENAQISQVAIEEAMNEREYDGKFPVLMVWEGTSGVVVENAQRMDFMTPFK